MAEPNGRSPPGSQTPFEPARPPAHSARICDQRGILVSTPRFISEHRHRHAGQASSARPALASARAAAARLRVASSA
eukprot:15441316-Alexandrium_andersonii.AAC.1